MRERDKWWCVTVKDATDEIVTIESECLSGREIGPDEDGTILKAASHLLGFIGRGYDADAAASLASKDAENAELRAFAQQATKSLTSLAGGGSENFIRGPGDEIYLADVPYCEQKLRERISRLHKQIDDFAERYAQAAQEPKQLRVQLHAAESRLTTALAALGEARKALRVCERQLRYVGNGTEDPAIHDTAETARATLAKLNALEGNEDGTR